MKPPICTRVIDSTPAHTNTSPASSWIAPAAMWIACIEEPQKRLTVVPAVAIGRCASSAISRATFMPCSPSGKAQPTITSSTSSAGTPVRAISASTTCAARSSGRTLASAPLCAKSKGERAKPAITTFLCIEHPLLAERAAAADITIR